MAFFETAGIFGDSGRFESGPVLGYDGAGPSRNNGAIGWALQVDEPEQSGIWRPLHSETKTTGQDGRGGGRTR